MLTCIRANGDKISLYTPAQISAWANTMICKWLIAKAKENIAESKFQTSEQFAKARSARASRSAFPWFESYQATAASL